MTGLIRDLRYAVRTLRGSPAIATLAVAAGASTVVRSVLDRVLYKTSPTDPVIFTGVPIIVMIAALVASLIPAARAAWLDAWVALQTD